MDGVFITDQYHPAAGFVYIFNLIVGTGALTMPKAFSSAGWLLSLIIIIMLSFMSFVTVTFVMESMSHANAVVKSKRKLKITRMHVEDEREADSVSESSRLLDVNSEEGSFDDKDSRSSENPNKLMLFDITHRIELGTMAKIFLPSLAVKFFYTAIAVYLYGDLVIYAAAISKSIRDVSCSVDQPCNETVTGDFACWNPASGPISRTSVYRMFVAVVLVVLGPLAYFDVNKTKYIQILTTVFRWVSFASMIILAGIALGGGKGKGHPPAVNFNGLPNLFGVCVYSFMCHHSLPTLITPIARKRKIYWLLFSDYGLILGFYLLLSFTGSYTFDVLQDMYTLNFQPQKCSSGSSEEIVPAVPFLQYFLPLFPVVTLSTSFPIIAITLTYNLKTLLMQPILAKLGINSSQESYSLGSSDSVLSTYSSHASNARKVFWIERIFFPSIAVIPPVCLALVTEDLQILVGIVGSYAGACIQYVIPALLIYFARKHEATRIEELPLDELKTKIQMTSPFKSKYWIPFVLLWSIVCMIFVTIDHIIDHSGSSH